MNLLKAIGQFIGVNLVAVLFLIGVIILNVSTYLQFSLTIGLFVTGITLIIIALIYQYERANTSQ